MFSPVGGGCGPIRRRHPFQNRFEPNMDNLWNVHDYNYMEDETEEEEDDEDEDDDVIEISEEEDSDDDGDSEESEAIQETDENGKNGFGENSYLDAKEPVPSTSSNIRRHDGLGHSSHTFR